MTELKLKSYEFRREREAGWRELETLLAKAGRGGLRSMTAEELSRLPMLYRSTLSSLSVARSISLDRNLLSYLENVTARAYLCVYGTRKQLGSTVIDFFVSGWPQVVRGFRWQIAIAAVVLISGVLAGFVLTLQNSERYYMLVPAAVQGDRTPASSTEQLRAVLFDTDANAAEALMTFATFLFSHNAWIGMLAFSIGFVAGIPVFYLLFTNGLMLGAFAALHHGRDLTVEFWGWILPHGITELGAVVLCGAGGLALAQSLLFPGEYSRLRNLAQRGRRAGALVIGAVVMFFCAALIEGIFRQTVTHTGTRYAVAAATALLWSVYFITAGRRKG